MVLTLYKLDASPAVRTVYMTMELLGIKDVKMQDVNLFNKDQLKEEYLKLNPQHTVPTLIDDDFVIWDSHAIAAYLVNKYAPGHSIYPADPKKRAIIDQRFHFESGILFPALRGTVGPIFFGGEKQFNPDFLEKIKASYDFVEKFLTQQWLAGDQMTLADISCGATISSLDIVLPIDQNAYPKLSSWYKRCCNLEVFKKCNLPGATMFAGALKNAMA